MDAIDKELGLLAEMALAAPDLRGFELAWFEHWRASFGFETACSVWTDRLGVTLSASAAGYPEPTLSRRFSQFMGELSADEIAGFSAEMPALDLDVVPRRRRERLTVYSELLAPAGVACFVTNVWQSRWGAFGFHLGRCAGSSPFKPRDIELLSRVVPGVKLGQALHAANQLHGVPEAEWWAEAWRLSAREREAANLVARGLSNPEIAGLLRVSRHTIRNHLASVFRKARVSTRAELVFAMTIRGDLAAESERARHATNGAWSAFLERCGVER